MTLLEHMIPERPDMEALYCFSPMHIEPCPQSLGTETSCEACVEECDPTLTMTALKAAQIGLLIPLRTDAE